MELFLNLIQFLVCVLIIIESAGQANKRGRRERND